MLDYRNWPSTQRACASWWIIPAAARKNPSNPPFHLARLQQLRLWPWSSQPAQHIPRTEWRGSPRDCRARSALPLAGDRLRHKWATGCPARAPGDATARGPLRCPAEPCRIAWNLSITRCVEAFSPSLQPCQQNCWQPAANLLKSLLATKVEILVRRFAGGVRAAVPARVHALRGPLGVRLGGGDRHGPLADGAAAGRAADPRRRVGPAQRHQVPPGRPHGPLPGVHARLRAGPLQRHRCALQWVMRLTRARCATAAEIRALSLRVQNWPLRGDYTRCVIRTAPLISGPAQECSPRVVVLRVVLILCTLLELTCRGKRDRSAGNLQITEPHTVYFFEPPKKARRLRYKEIYAK